MNCVYRRIVASSRVSGAVLLFLNLPVAWSATPLDHLVQRLKNEVALGQAGLSVADAGDVDGDGIHDVIIGLQTVATGDEGNHTSALLFSGATGLRFLEVPAPVPQPELSQNSVCGLGDLNGDGRAEFAVGTPGADGTPTFGGFGIVRLFKSDGGLIDSIPGPVPGARFSMAIASVGDVNADGFADLAIGAPEIDRVYIHSGMPSASFPLLATLSPPADGQRFGASVAPGGALGSPGSRLQGAVVVGAPWYRPGLVRSILGRVYVFDLANPATPMFTVEGEGPTDHLGSSVDGDVDINADGVPDFLGGAMGSTPGGDDGSGYVRLYSGADASELRTLPAIEAGDLFGFSASFGGRCDLAGATVVVGAPQAVHPDTALTTGAVAVFQATTGDEIATIFGDQQLDGLGTSVSGFVNVGGGPGAEFVAGAPGVDVAPAGLGAGVAYILSCTPQPHPAISATPSPIFFAELAPGAMDTVEVTVENGGAATLDVSSAALTPGSSPAFSLSNGPSSFSLAPGATQLLEISYAPLQVQADFGKLRFISNDPETPELDVPLSGSAAAPAIAADPLDIELEFVDVGSAAWSIIRVFSVGDTPLTVSGIDFADGLDGDFSLGNVPGLPLLMEPGQHQDVHVMFQPTETGGQSTVVRIESDDPQQPQVDVIVGGTGVDPNEPPVAIIEMDVPYGGQKANAIQFRGNSSFDPNGPIVSYAWEFGHDGQTSGFSIPLHELPIGGFVPRYFVVRLTVQDSAGKSDTTSITALTSTRKLRSRFYGRVLQGGSYFSAGTVVEAWIDGFRVAVTEVQTHLGRGVYAIEVRPEDTAVGGGFGGNNGDEVSFRINGKLAPQKGTWYEATDQELILQIPIHVGPELADPNPNPPDPWCILLPGGLIACVDDDGMPEGGYDLGLATPNDPPPPPLGFAVVGAPFQLDVFDGRTGSPVGELSSGFEIQSIYTPTMLAEAGVEAPQSLALYELRDGTWSLFARGQIDTALGRVLTTLLRPGTFALLGEGSATAPRFVRGDCNADGVTDLSDAIRYLGFLFIGGAEPPCLEACNSNGDPAGDLSDSIYLLNHLFLGGPAPAAPYPSCGSVPSVTRAECKSYPSCD